MQNIFKIAIIGAMDCEINDIKKEIKDLEEQNYADLKIFIGTINNKTVILAQSGVGKVNAALNTQYIIDTYKPDIIINTGVAGGIADGLDVGDGIVTGRGSLEGGNHDVEGSAVLLNRLVGEGARRLAYRIPPQGGHGIVATPHVLESQRIEQGFDG